MIERLKKVAPAAKQGGHYFAHANAKRKFVSTGSKLLDLALGGGWAEGRIANIKGDRSVGKTLLLVETAANFARKYPKPKGKSNIFYRETEAAFDLDYGESQGLPVSQISFNDELRTVEDFYDDLAATAKAVKDPCLYILDTLDSLSDEAEMERDIRKGSFGGAKAKKMSEAFRRLIRDISKHMTVLIASQLRDNVGVIYGPKTTRSGGRSMDFYASQVVMLKQLSVLTETRRGLKREIGRRIHAKVEKNKIALPGREAEFKIIHGYGVDDVEACLEWLHTIKRLRDVGVAENKTAVERYLDSLDTLNEKDYHAKVASIHGVVSKHWYEIEECFLPTRRKYVGLA